MTTFAEYLAWLEEAVKFYRKLDFFRSGSFLHLTDREVVKSVFPFVHEGDLENFEHNDHDWGWAIDDLMLLERDSSRAFSLSQSGSGIDWYLEAFDLAKQTSRGAFCPGDLKYEYREVKNQSNEPLYFFEIGGDESAPILALIEIEQRVIQIGEFSHDQVFNGWKHEYWLELLIKSVIELQFELFGTDHRIWITEFDSDVGVVDCISGFLANTPYQFVELVIPAKKKFSDTEFPDSNNLSDYYEHSKFACLTIDEINRISTRGLYPRSFFIPQEKCSTNLLLANSSDHQVSEAILRKQNRHFALSFPDHPLPRQYDKKHILPLFYRGLYRIRTGDEGGGWDDWNAAAQLGFPNFYEVAEQIIQALY